MTVDKEFTEVPILIGFDQSKPVGWLLIRTDALPPTPTFCFSLGIRGLEMEEKRVTRYELVCVSPVDDESYKNYLEAFGVGSCQPMAMPDEKS